MGRRRTQVSCDRNQLTVPYRVSNETVDELRDATQRFIRGFGLLASNNTPCGKPLSTAQAHALLVLLARGELSQHDLVQELGIDKSNVARLSAKLVREGQAKQRTGAEDGRSRLVALTDKGAKLAREVDKASRARFASVIAALPSGRVGPIVESLRQLNDAIGLTQTPREDL